MSATHLFVKRYKFLFLHSNMVAISCHKHSIDNFKWNKEIILYLYVLGIRKYDRVSRKIKNLAVAQ